jgi:hypothetical protein
MARFFQCPYCGTNNKVGQRYCSNCRIGFYYTCKKCNSSVDPSFTFCPNCSTPLNWAVKPQVNQPQQPPYPVHRSKLTTRFKVITVLAIVVFLLAATIAGYIFNRLSIYKPLTFQGYDSVEEPSTVPEQYVTAPPESQYLGNPPYKVGPSDSFQLVNNSNAVDASFEELKNFIIMDKTDEAIYIPDIRMCGNFAQEVHNNAEQAGIKAAVVIVEFTNGKTHALNAFQTTDMGLVYIDCTGVIKSPDDLEDSLYRLVHPFGQDRMAYVETDKEYGTIPLQEAESPQYSYYVGYSKGWFNENFFFSQPAIVKSIKIYW